ncbi:MAG: alpha/beta hydrolase [Ignavibacteriales bacterium]|nr:alpha/beta hydrolase [Ignavibacteriales bacterium]
MKKLIFLALLGIIVFSGCAGFKYQSMPSLEFQDIDYSYPTKTVLSNPSVAYADLGSGENTIILIHGLASNAGFWRYNTSELAKNNRVIVIDLPGYGKSQKGDYPYTLSFYAETVKNLITTLKLKNVTLVGHSMGGQISIIFALKYPELIKNLVLAAPAGFEKFQYGEGEWLRSVMDAKAVRLNPEDGVRKNLAMNFYNWDEKWEWMVEERVRMAKGAEMREFSYAVVKCVSAMLDEPTYNSITGLQVPTLIVYGKYDGLIPNMYLNPGFPSDVFIQGAAKIKNSKLVEIDNCGHMIMIEKAGEFNKVVLDFIK